MYDDDHQQSNDTHKLKNHILDRWPLRFFFFFWNAHWSPSFRTHTHTENKQNINATACLVNRLKSRINYLDVFIKHVLDTEMGFPGITVVKHPPTNAGDARDVGSIPGSGRSPGEGNATYSSILAWKIPWSEEPGGPESMGSQRVGHNWTSKHTQILRRNINRGRAHGPLPKKPKA